VHCSLGRVVWIGVGEPLELLLVDRLQEVVVDRSQFGQLARKGLVKVGHVKLVALKMKNR
jgi:hypothetical protein